MSNNCNIRNMSVNFITSWNVRNKLDYILLITLCWYSILWCLYYKKIKIQCWLKKKECMSNHQLEIDMTVFAIITLVLTLPGLTDSILCAVSISKLYYIATYQSIFAWHIPGDHFTRKNRLKSLKYGKKLIYWMEWICKMCWQT